MAVVFGTSSKGKPTVIYQNLDIDECLSAEHPAPENTISAGYDWRKAPICKKYRTLNDRVVRGCCQRMAMLKYLCIFV